MRAAVTALAWEIWQRNRRSIWLVLGIILAGWLFNMVLPASFRVTDAGRSRLLTVNGLMAAGSLALVGGIFNYTELNPQREWAGFPCRLFTLPVGSLPLVATPMVLGVAAVELVYLAWTGLVFAHGELVRPGWFAVLLGAYMVFYQTLLWCLASVRIVRTIMLGLVGTSAVGVAFLPFWAQYIPSPWLSEEVLIALLAGLALLSFLAAWACVARQRCGGGRRHSRLRSLCEGVLDAMPRRNQHFRSPAAAQFWFEWRRSGLLLPLAVATILAAVIGPLSWLARHDADSTLWILGWTLALPVILAAAVGKGFSKPDFWSRDLSVPVFLAVRPLATGEIVAIRLKVAALSAAIAWSLVFAFLALWLPLWAELASLNTVRIGFWMIYDHSMFAQYVIAALTLLAGAFLTWKVMVNGLWIGLSGSKPFFVASIALGCFVGLSGMIALTVLLNHHESFRAWIRKDPNELLSWFEWAVATGVIAKSWAAAFSWRNIRPGRVRSYSLAWLAGTIVLVALVILVWRGGRFWLPVDASRLRNLLILVAFLVIPFARLGLAPAALAKNRHR